MIDIEAETRSLQADEVVLLQRMKTGALFEFACEAGALLADAGASDHGRLRAYAGDFGLAFQITDDLLDVLSTAEKAGKSVGKDKDQGKATLVSIKGVDGAQEEARKLVSRAGAHLDFYGAKADDLRALALFLLDRES
jgi:farnesyl diphosphate synthase